MRIFPILFFAFAMVLPGAAAFGDNCASVKSAYTSACAPGSGNPTDCAWAKSQMDACAAKSVNQTGCTDPKCQAVQQAVEACQSSSSDAQSSCMTSPGDMTSSISASVDSISTSTAGISGQCGAMGTVSGAVNAALLGMKLNCSSSYSSCTDDCNEASSAVSKVEAGAQKDSLRQDLRDAQNTCRQAASALQDIQAKVAAISSSIQQTVACQAAAANQTLLQQCQANPTGPGCAALLASMATDCSNPTIAASDLTCICRQNPRDGRCGYSAALTGLNPNTGSNLTSGESAALRAAEAANAAGNFDPGSLGGAFDPGVIAGGQGGAGGAGALPGSGGGGGGLGGAHGANSPGKNGKGALAATGKLNPNITAGSRSGTPGGYGGPSGNNGLGNYQARGPAANGPAKVDLSRFLPGQKNDPRFNSGISGPDGITGPYSDNWQKMNNRYEAVKTSLTP